MCYVNSSERFPGASLGVLLTVLRGFVEPPPSRSLYYIFNSLGDLPGASFVCNINSLGDLWEPPPCVILTVLGGSLGLLSVS